MTWSILQRTFNPILFLVLIVLIHLFLISKTFSIDSAGNMRAASAGYGDIPFHMTEVSKFAFQKQFDFNEPIYDGDRMRYSFLINASSGLILRFWGNWNFAMQFPVMLSMASATFLIFIIYKNLLLSGWRALAAIVIFLFGAGFGANWHIREYLTASMNPNFEGFIKYLVDNTASTITKYDAVFPRQNIAWGTPLSLVFLHQRSFFAGIIIFALFIYFFLKWQRNPRSILMMLFMGILVGIGPLAHFHTFVVMYIVLFISILIAIVKEKWVLFERLLLLGLTGFIISVPQLIYLVQGKTNEVITGSSFFHLRLGWMVQPTIGSVKFNPADGLFWGEVVPFLSFLWLNFGVILPIFLICGFIIYKSSNFRDKFKGIGWWWLTGIVLFLFVQTVRLQPWDYDNNKVLVYFQFFAAPIFVAFFVWIIERRKLIGNALLAIFLILATYSGFVDQIPRLLVPNNKLPIIFNTDAIATAKYIKEYIPDGEDLITTSTHLNPVSSLAGRPVLVGYPGWLWTRGINYGKRESDVKLFFSNPETYKFIADSYGSKYALVDPPAIFDWDTPVYNFDNNFELVFEKGGYRIYKLH